MLGALVVAVLAGCAASPVPVPTPSPTDAAAPLFASDEEALAAAEAAYAAYLAASDAMLADGGRSPNAMRSFAIGQALEYELTGAADFLARNLRATGETRFSTYRLQSVRSSELWAVEVGLYVCDDLSDVDLVDAVGESQALPNRPVHIPYFISIVGDVQSGLRVAEKTLWEEGSFCS
ncbi:hypothetical protein [Microterricola gilva]|uniref:hypothetical protein n=1 Tax=Microterricola gilva TaxID=393267 RepID=UPI00102B24DA|nr:hypothetical protein [Microterricola gilva]